MTTNARAAYLDASIATASPARLLVMLYDRLVLDVQRALDAAGRGDLEGTHHHLVHAQDIVMELHSSLRADQFKGGQGLSDLYGYLHRQLVRANTTKNAELTADCLGIIIDLADVWRQAALESAVLPRGA